MPSGLLADCIAPAHLTYPEYAKSFGQEVAELSTMAGFGPDPEQRLLLELIFAVDKFGRTVAFEVGVDACRQNLKTGLLKMCALGWLWITEQNLIVWTAHEFATSQESFRDMTQLIESCPNLDREVKAIHRANGDEAIELKNGQRLKFKARTKGGGRGWTGDKVILDEAMFLRPVHMGSLLPTLSAVPDPQVVMAGSAGLLDSEVWRGVRDRGRAGDSGSLIWAGWNAPSGGCASSTCDHSLSMKGCALDNPENWRRANPAMGRRITQDYIAAERQALPPQEFARERMGWWEDPVAGSSGITPDMWSACGDPDSTIVDVPALVLDVSPSRWSAIAVGGHRGDGIPHVEVPFFAQGTDWAVDKCAELIGRWGMDGVWLDPAGPAGSLLPAFEAAGIAVHLLSGREMAQACGAFYNAVADELVRHLGNDDWLNIAVAGAQRRPLGDAWAWARRTSQVDIAPLVAATVALHAASLPPAEVDVSLSVW